MVSVIIPTTDKEKAMLDKSIDALNMSTYRDIEIIVVNEGAERSVQRNIGISRAKGEYIMYLDTDQQVSSGLIGECVRLCEHGFSSVYIPEQITTPGFFGRLRNWERQFYTATAIDCVRFIKRENCPFFDESISGPEDSIHDRMVTGFKAISRNVLYHEDNVGVVDYFKKKIYYAKSMGKFAEKYPHDKVLKFWWRCFGVFMENGKHKRVLRNPGLFLLTMLLIFSRGVIYVVR